MRTRNLAVALVFAMGTGCASDVANLDGSSSGGHTNYAGATFDSGTTVGVGGATIGGAGNVGTSGPGGVGGALRRELCGVSVYGCKDGIVSGIWDFTCNEFSIPCENGCKSVPDTLVREGGMDTARERVVAAYCESASTGGASTGGASSGGTSSGGTSNAATSGGVSKGGSSSGGSSSGGASARWELCTVQGTCRNGNITVRYGWFCWEMPLTCEYGCLIEGGIVSDPYFDIDGAVVTSIAKSKLCRTSGGASSGGASSGGASSGGTSNLSTTSPGGASSGGASSGGTSSL